MWYVSLFFFQLSSINYWLIGSSFYWFNVKFDAKPNLSLFIWMYALISVSQTSLSKLKGSFTRWMNCQGENIHIQNHWNHHEAWLIGITPFKLKELKGKSIGKDEENHLEGHMKFIRPVKYIIILYFFILYFFNIFLLLF